MTLVAILFFSLYVNGMPVPFAFGISGVAFFLLNPTLPLTMPVQQVLSQTQNFLLLAIPLFIFAGNLLNETGITERVMKLASVLTGHMRAGMAQSNMVIAASLGGITSSAIGDAAMLSRVLGPGMTQKGYSGGFSAAVIGCSALITTMIPPGIGLVLYGSIAEVSIGRLFTAGMIPGILMTIFLMVAVGLRAKQKGYLPEREKRAPLKEIAKTFVDCIWAFFSGHPDSRIKVWHVYPVRSRRFRVCLCRCYWNGRLQAVFVERNGPNPGEHGSRCRNGHVIDRFVGDLQLRYCLGSNTTKDGRVHAGDFQYPWLVMLIIIGFLLFAGTFMDSTVLILMLTSILTPIAEQVNVDLVHFGSSWC